MRRAAVRRLRNDPRELGKPLEQVALLASQLAGRRGGRLRVARVPQDPRDPRVRVLHVVDRILSRLLPRKVDVDLDRLVVAARDEVPARGVDADLVEEARPATRRRLGASTSSSCSPPRVEVDELVEQHLDALRVVAEHARDRAVPVARAVMVGAEDVDRTVEAAVELVDEVDDVGRAIGRRAAVGERMSTRSSSSPYADERAQIAPSFS